MLSKWCLAMTPAKGAKNRAPTGEPLEVTQGQVGMAIGLRSSPSKEDMLIITQNDEAQSEDETITHLQTCHNDWGVCREHRPDYILWAQPIHDAQSPET
jgi:hypothetical protein